MSTFSGLEFERIGEIEPERDKSGNYAELMPQSRFVHAGSTRLHAYGDGPFCRFRIARREVRRVLIRELNPVWNFSG